MTHERERGAVSDDREQMAAATESDFDRGCGAVPLQGVSMILNGGWVIILLFFPLQIHRIP